MGWIDGLALWTLNNAGLPLPKLHGGFCDQIVTHGIKLWRSSLGIELLHPDQGGVRLLWTLDGELVATEAPAGLEKTPDYLDSPVRIVDETNQPYRQRLEGVPQVLPLLRDIQENGATDYVIYPLPFLDGSRSAYLSFATREAGGFSDAGLDILATSAKLLSPYAERRALRRMAIDLLDTYVGHHAGERIFSGQIRRGALDTIEAAILMCDLRGFTALSRNEAQPIVVETLNAWFETVATAIEGEGGEILKFMGDGLLAIFRATPDAADACRRAYAAAESMRESVAALNVQRSAAGEGTIAYAMGLHVGELAYGNVGGRSRLDFTVLGQAVNYASRLQDLAKRLNQPVLMSRDFADCLAARLTDLGTHPLRSIGKAEQVFALPAAA